MKNLLYKEWKLALHPTVILFMALSLMLLIPNYPYYVVFFYTTLGLFFVCLTGRENRDLEYTMALPVQKRDAVRARIGFGVAVELCQFLLAALAAALRGLLGGGPNQAGMDANTALFAGGFALMGLFNHSFFPRYYRDPGKVGKAFALSSVLFFLWMILLEACVFVVPFFKNRLDTPDPLFLWEKLCALLLGIALFCALTLHASRKAERYLEALDLS